MASQPREGSEERRTSADIDLRYINHSEVTVDSSPEDLALALADLFDEEIDGRRAPRLRAMAGHLPIGFLIIGRDLTIQSAFGGTMRRMGLEDDALDGFPVEVFGSESVERVGRALGGDAVVFDSEGAIGSQNWALHLVLVPLPSGDVGGIAIDITERQVVKQALDASETRFRSLADNAPVGIFLSDPDRGNIYTNAELQRQLGLPPEQTLGSEWQKSVHPDDAHMVRQATQRLRDDGEPFDLEYRILRPDGEQRWLHITAHHFHDHNGDTAGVIGTSRDVTDRRQVVDELLAREQRFRTMAESAPIGIFLADLSGEVVYANAHLLEISGRGRDAASGTAWVEAILPEDLPLLIEAERAFRDEGRPFDIEVRVLRLDGEVRWVHSHASAMVDDEGTRFGAVGTVMDVTERRRAEERRRESEDLTRAILETAAEGIVTVDEDGTILAFNAAAEQIFGWDSDDAIGQSFGMLLPEPHREVYMSHLDTFRSTGETILAGAPAQELPGLRLDGTTVPVEIAVTAVPWRGQTAFTALVRDVSERKEFERELEHQATHDPLTALPNRALLAAQLESALARAYRSETSVAVLFVSLDRLKMVTDSLGHRAGDELRVAAAHRLQGAVRPTDTVTRFGEDEFVVLAEDLVAIGEAVDLAQRVIEALDVPFDLTVDEAFINVNIGISFALDGLGTAESLISDADVAMYRARDKGGSHFEIFDSEMRSWVNSRRKTENALRHGIERDEFELHYQPIISLVDGTIKGLEALVRWERPHLGRVPPIEFIPVAEESGLIVPLGGWIVGEACRRLGEWQRREPDRHLTVSVNLSGRQLAQRDIAEVVARAIEEAEADPSGLVIEITETVLLDDVEQAVRTLAALKGIGVQLSIDDFGTGYSSLTYLRRFPIDIVKVDRSFVNQLGTDSRDASIVEMVVTLAHGLDLDCVAEGVETKEQLAALTELECGFAQGFYFAKPQPADEIDSLLAGDGFSLA